MKDLHRVTALLQRRYIDLDSVLTIAEVGSTAHGISVGEQDDLDLTVVRMEKWDEFVWGPDANQSMMVRTQPEGERSGPGDIDLQVYTARKFTRLALGGNPSILVALYSPTAYVDDYKESGIMWRLLADTLKKHTPSKRAGAAFSGYMTQQLERWQGTRGQKNVNRPELVEAYGYDTKYAAHIIRLGYQGIEYMTHGSLTLPMRAHIAEALRNLRTGGYSETHAKEWADDVIAQLGAAKRNTKLPDEPNTAQVEMRVADIYDEWFRYV